MIVDNAWTPDICIYHANCTDGFGAAYAVWKHWPATMFVPAGYGDLPPVIDAKNVLIVDFSYSAETLETMADSATSIVVLDHHQSAERQLAGFHPFYGTCRDVDRALRTAKGAIANVLVNFDMARSGAVMAWEFAHPGSTIPDLLLYVQDRDLWRFALDDSRALNAYIGSLDHDFVSWDNVTLYGHSKAAGETILRLQRKNLAALLDAATRKMRIGGYEIPVANVPFYMASDAGNVLAEGNPFAATYFDRADGQRQFSLRSHRDGVDVSEIAKAFGGGGHRNAAGFTVPGGWEGEV